jgi:hypothetical protein
MQIEVIGSVTKTIGSLALAYPYLRRLQVAESIEALVTAGKERQVPTGQVIEVLILNRLSLRPVPISKIGAWAQTQAIEEVYGLAAVRQYLHLDQPLVVGDSKLITRANQLGFSRVGAHFVGPTSLRAADRAVLRRAWAAGAPWQRLDPPAAGATPTAGRYWELVHDEVLLDPECAVTYPLRRLFVQSLEARRAVQHRRAKDPARARRALWTIKRRLGHPAYRDPATVQRKVAEAIARVRSWVQVRLTLTPGGLDLRWHLQRAALREEARFDGLYALVTNLLPTQAPVREVFRLYKRQRTVEGRFRVVKHPPIRVRPLWLHQPQRIESLVFVVMVALFLFALIERAARRVVQESGQVFTGLRPEGRDQLPVTSEPLIAAFAPLSLVKQRLRVAGEVVALLTPTTLTPIQAQIPRLVNYRAERILG